MLVSAYAQMDTVAGEEEGFVTVQLTTTEEQLSREKVKVLKTLPLLGVTEDVKVLD